MKRIIAVVPAQNKLDCNVFANTIDKVGGEDTFTVGLCAVGDASQAVTHYWCSWIISDWYYDKLRTYLSGVAGASTFDGGKVLPDDVLSQLGLKTLAISLI